MRRAQEAGPVLSIFAPLAAAVFLLAAPGALAADVGWPREIKTSSGGTIVVYEPQVESLKGDQLKIRAAVSYTKKGQAEPVFGAFWATGRLKTDRDAGTATFVSATVGVQVTSQPVAVLVTLSASHVTCAALSLTVVPSASRSSACVASVMATGMPMRPCLTG